MESTRTAAPPARTAGWLVFTLLIFLSSSALCVALFSLQDCGRPAPRPAPPADIVPEASASVRTSSLPGLAEFVVPAAFPTSVYDDYYVYPGPTNQPQPVIRDPVLNKTFPLNLTSPYTVPTGNDDPLVYPEAEGNLTESEKADLVASAMLKVMRLIDGNGAGSDADPSDSCSRCTEALSIGQRVARRAPTALPDALVSICQATHFMSDEKCASQYAADAFGTAWTQILAKADVKGLDGQYMCASLNLALCPRPGVQSVKAVFPKPKPANAAALVPKRSGKRVKVLHLSDLHLDARYLVGSEADCRDTLCCRAPLASKAPGMGGTAVPAPLYGYFLCDSPYYLALAAMQAIGPLTGTSLDNPPAMTLYTGDLVAHDPIRQLSQAYVEYVETSLWQMFQAYIGGPIYCALGNHDTAPADLDVPHAIDDDGALGRQFSWNYEHVARLWAQAGWVDNATAADAASLHYGAYALRHPLGGLRIITINTDMYFKSNPYAFLRTADPDYSGIFSFLIEELQKAEDAGERAYIVGHASTGWDGYNALPNAADLFYQIIERYSPHVVANVFFGHTHEDQAFVYYAHNGTEQTAAHALVSAWVGPSITPLMNLNSGFRLYEVDTGSWEVMDAYTYFADVATFSGLDKRHEGGHGGEHEDDHDANHHGPVFRLEYSTRAAYGDAAGWPADAPLNATFWHRVTEALEADRSHVLVNQMNTFQGKSSVHTPNCTSDACAAAKVCYMRSGSTALGRECPQGFGSVQSPFTGYNY